LRGTRETGACLLIALSGYGQAEDLQRSREAGFDRHLVKPVDMQKLREILDGIDSRSPLQAAGAKPRQAAA
jgi:CheY-like chemotaxis protein